VLIAFASDYGLADEFVGVCKAVMLGLVPDVRIIDLGHDIPPHNVRAGALLLVRSVQYLPDDSIVVAVVDPGVGTDRRLIGVEVAGGILLGPDNGLLAPAVALAGGARTVVSLENTEYHLPAPGPTFSGRDILAPAAGYLAGGVALTELGPVVDPAGLVPGLVGLPETDEGGAIVGEVWWVDRFGNCQLNVDPAELTAARVEPGDPVEVHLGNGIGGHGIGGHGIGGHGIGGHGIGGSGIRAARWVHTYADAKPSELVLLVDSYGLLSLAMDRESAASALGLRAGSAVTLVPEGASVTGTRSPA
jgi:S-adenosyl-L-methionine hydrolase (adenosine-forming)